MGVVNMEANDFMSFLEQRRALMTDLIKKYYYSL